MVVRAETGVGDEKKRNLQMGQKQGSKEVTDFCSPRNTQEFAKITINMAKTRFLHFKKNK